MNINKIIANGIKEFKQKIRKNCKNMNFEELATALYLEFSDCLKNAVSDLGKKILKEYLMYFDIEKDSVVMNEKELKFKFKSTKAFLTFFGEIELERSLYQHDRGGKCYFPLDVKWGVENEYTAPDVQEAILYSSAHLTPAETESLFKKCAFFNPSTTAVNNVIKRAGKIIEKNIEKINTEIVESEKVPANTEIIVGSMDGANVLIRQKGVKKGKKMQRPHNNKQGDLEKKNTCYKNAMVGTISFYQKKIDEDDYPARIGTKYMARMPEKKAVTLKQQFENQLKETLQKAPDDITKIVITDGARGLWKYVNENELYNDFEKLIDFFHTTEHLSKAAEALFGKKNEKADNWYNKYRTILLTEENSALKIIRSIEYYKKKTRTNDTRKKEIKTELTFFKRNVDKMNYVYFLNNGWPIGSGPVEAACKSIIKTRLCRSGMRWSIKGGQAILNLRTIVKSERWDRFWDIYQDIRKCA